MSSTTIQESGIDGLQATIAEVEAARSHVRWRFERVVSMLERAADLGTALAAQLAIYALSRSLGLGWEQGYRFEAALMASAAFAVLFVFMLDRSGAYNVGNSLLRIRETERILRVSAQTFGFLFAVAFFTGHLYSRLALALAFVVVPVAVIVQKQLAFLLIRTLNGRGYGVQPVLIYGAGDTGRRVFSALARSPKIGLRPVAIVDDNGGLAGRRVYEYGYRREQWVPVVPGPLTGKMLRDYGASLVIVAIPSLEQENFNQIATTAFESLANVAFVPHFSYRPAAFSSYVDIDGVLISTLSPVPSHSGYAIAKRVFDVLCSVLLLVFSAPLWGVIAFLIRRDSPGPVFFHQDRVGLNGRLFKLYKFRTMAADAPKYDFHPKNENDKRVTQVGRWLRRTSLDELPQLLNIVRGDMSLVGPRPEMPFIVAGYNERQWQRLRVVPGLTGLWQLSADRNFLIHENLGYDLYYIRNRNFFMDLAILLHTLVFAMRGL